MPLKIIRGDITRIKADAIVNAANNSLLGGGGVDGCIHRVAGPELLKECATLGGCSTGDAKITKGYRLPCKYVIHTVGPRWNGGGEHEEELLASCYKTSLDLALSKGCNSVAFPLVSAGAYGYPKDKALRVAIDTISDFLLSSELLVYIVIFNNGSYCIDRELYSDISAYIERLSDENEPLLCSAPTCYDCCIPLKKESIKEKLMNMDESFSQMLLRKIDEKGMSDVQCYKKANVDRKLFSKIRSNVNYRPSKTTAIAFAIALELSLDETEDMLKKAGFALSHSNKFDIIIEYFISKGNYNIYEINEALFAFDQNLLGA